MIITVIAARLMGRVKATVTKCSETTMSDYITPEQAHKHECMLVNHAAHADIPPPEPETTIARMIAGAVEMEAFELKTSYGTELSPWYEKGQAPKYFKRRQIIRVHRRLVIDLPPEETE